MNKLNEFAASDGQSMSADPAVQGDASRGADQKTGEASYQLSTKAEVLAAIMNDLQNRSSKEVFDVYHAMASANPEANRRSADKMIGGGETYEVATASPSSVLPQVAREQVEEIFTGQELSEELKEKAAIVYEAAVNARISIVEARLEEQYTEALQEAIDLIHEEVVEAVDKYMSYVAKEWVEENQLAIDNNLKAEMAEELINNLKETLEANYITVSDEKVDVLENMSAEIESLKSRLNEEFEARISLQEKLESYKVSELVDQISEGMTVSQREKFVSLVENISYSDYNDFSKKAETIRETYFSGTTVKNSRAEPLTESLELDNEPEKAVPSNMKAYADALARISK